ncbi:hypothetical protein FA15DRAFT_591146 [Coprinopsis marcescibilis]|uniref:ceramidase n=1 Tax=Coprinopsis marcescibilis TaxID=230819 RepID=A0A5C3KXE3_COPMA|nr:hypothetical protein FA15DRAFT_591146 [Coprinopsis marcescibilis]
MTGNPQPPPLYIIDLSKPPKERYADICKDFTVEIKELSQVYDEILQMTGYPRILGCIAKLLLRRVFSKDETKEIRGISEASGIPLNLVVAYNTFLDLFSGCVSGGVQVQERGMLHFRGLDWHMEPLREMIIRVQYVRGGKVVARAVTYAGYVGTLTGVREGLSIALNYRARINSSHTVRSHRWHQLSLLLGWRPSISSQLRTFLLSPGPAPTLAQVAEVLAQSTSSPCYLTFCSPTSVMLVEKDLRTAVVHESDNFLSVTNHDKAMEGWTQEDWHRIITEEGIPDVGGVHDIMKDSIERKECMSNLWKTTIGADGTAAGPSASSPVTVGDVKQWLRTYPIRNETTHFSCIMDPSAPGGGLVWVETCEGALAACTNSNMTTTLI